MKFLLDMGISVRSAQRLRALGYDAQHLSELGLNRLDDAEILLRAREQGRVLLTHDLDFADLMASGGATLPTVVIFRLADMRPANVDRHLDSLLEGHASRIEAGAIFSVDDGRVRARDLPIQPGARS